MPLQEADVKQITDRLDVLINLAAALFAKDLNNIDAIVKLDKMKLSRGQIANALSITNANVSQQLYLAGKRGDKKTDKKPKDVNGDAVVPEASTEAPGAPAEEA